MRARLLGLLLLSTTASSWAAGCAAGTAATVPDPRQTLTRFADAVERDDPRAAYALLSPRVQSETEWTQFERKWRDNRAELTEVARGIRDTDVEGNANARLALGDGETVVMVLEDGGWRLAGGVMDAQALATPLDTVAELRRALSRQSLPALLRVLSVERRAAWAAAFEQSMAATADPLDLSVEVRGDQAVVRTTGGGQILLKREAGQWHVWDVR